MIKKSIIPAQPGWLVVTPWWDGEKIERLFYKPIIAWLMTLDDVSRFEHVVMTEPITATGAAFESGVLRRPDGSCAIPDAREFESDDEVEDSFMRHRDKF